MSSSSETSYYIAITHHPNIPTDVLDDFTTALTPIDVHRREARSGVQASWELAGALLVVYLLKPYFDTFRKELLEGLEKAHITALKKAMRNVFETERPEVDYYNVVVYNKNTHSIVVINGPVSRLLREKRETC